MIKPPYRVPSMGDIRDIPWNGLSVVSTFSGCGGSCLGYRLAGYRVLYANEFIEAAQVAYKDNHPNSILDTRDIRTVQPEDILEKIGKKKGEVDILDGSPPCSAFSTAGSLAGGWGKVKVYSDSTQRVDDLFFEYARLLDGIQPKVFVAENVSGLVKGVAKGYFKTILKGLKSCGYNVSCKLLDAQWLGVPQTRQRLIFIGVRNDLASQPVHPTPYPYRYTASEALATLTTSGESRLATPGTQTRYLWDRVRMGGIFTEGLPAGQENWFSYVKLSPNKPSNTVVAKPMLFHWTEPRSLTIPELKRVTSFPDDFILRGSFDQNWERLGRSVPPLMMKAVASTIQREILSNEDTI